MPGVRGHFAPAVPGQEAIDHRGGHRSPQLLSQRGPERRHDQHPAELGLLDPGGEESLFLFQGHQGASATAPGLPRGGGLLASATKSRLQPVDGGSSHPQHGGGLFEGGAQLGWKQDRHRLAIGFEVGGLASDLVSTGYQVCVGLSWSCHEDTIAQLVSS